MARLEATTAIVLLVGAGALAAGSCEEPESLQHNGNSSFLGGSGGLGGAAAGLGGAGGGGGDGEGSIAGGAAGLTGAAGGDMGEAGGEPGDTGGAAGEAPGGAGGAPAGAGGAAEGGHPAGSAGAGGRAPSGTAGAGGRAMGAGGSTGAGGGTVAAGGRSGTGAGGAVGVGGAGGAPPCGTCTLSIQCRNYAPTDTTSMNAELWISNTGEQAIPLSMIKVRYFYTNEGGPMTLEIFDKALKRTDGTGYMPVTASFSMTSGKLSRPPMDFSEIAITGASVLDGTVPFYFKMAIHDLNHSKLTLTNDYSNPPSAIGPCPTIVALVNNAIAGGMQPMQLR